MTDRNRLIFSVDIDNRVVDCTRWQIDPKFTDPDNCLSSYLTEQVNIAFNGTFIPNERIYCIEYPERLPRCNALQDALEWKQNPYLKKKARCFRLQEVAFLFDEVKDSEDYVNVEYLKERLELLRINSADKTRLENFVKLQNERESNDHNRPLTAIASGDKMLPFDDSGRGVQAVQSYLQYIADHYFDRENEQLNRLELYYFRTSDKSMIDLARKCCTWFDPSIMNAEHKLPLFKPERAVYQDRQGLNNSYLIEECDMEAHWQDYHVFMEKFRLKPLSRNENIANLLMIADKGVPMSGKLFNEKSFVHCQEFRGVFNRIQHFTHEGICIPEDILQNQAKEMARRILIQQYDIRSFSYPEKNPNIAGKSDESERAAKSKSLKIK